MPATPLDVSLFDCATDPDPKHHTLDWPDDFVEFRRADAGGKDGILWSPASFVPGTRRLDANVTTLSALVLDYDAKAGPVDPTTIRDMWRGVDHVVHSTFTPGAFRCILLLRRKVTAAEYRKLYAWALGRDDRPDPSCKNPSRIFYWPTCRVDLDAPPYYRYNPGEPLDPDSVGLTSNETGSRGSAKSTGPVERRTSPGSSAFGETLPVAADALSAIAAMSPPVEPTGTGAAFAGIDRAEQREDAGLIEERCAFMRHARDDAATLPEPEWYAALSVWARCRGADDLVHVRSRPHPGYSAPDTEEKYQRARAVGPRTCSDIRLLSPACRGCPLSVTSPVLLGRRPDVEPPAPGEEPVDPSDAIAEAETALQAARVQEDEAYVKRQKSLSRLAVARKHGTEGGLEDASREKLAADASVRVAKAAREAAERRVADLKRATSVTGLPPGADPAVWARLRRETQRDGTVVPANTVANVLAVFEHDPRWSRRLSYNEFSLEVCLDGKPFPEESATELCAKLGVDYHLDTSSARVVECVAVVAKRRSFHPVRDWLESLSWDGVPRMERLLAEGFSCTADDDDLVPMISRAFCLSMVARAYKPGEQVDTVLVLVGNQGIGKSRVLEDLAGSDWFSRSRLSVGEKDSYLQLWGNWLYEIDEMHAFKKAEVTAVKSWITQSTDKFRAPYARRPSPHPRHTVIVGTTNETRFLADATGARRFWPFRVGARVNRAWVREFRDQVFAEAVAAYKAGEKWYFDTGSAEFARLEAHAQQFQIDHPWRGAVRRWVASRKAPFTETMVLTECVQMGLGDITAFHKSQMVDLLKALGCEPESRSVDGHSDWWYTTPDHLKATNARPAVVALPTRQ
jgi:predicted P-loop ATPase